MDRVTVVGGGIAGLVAAIACAEAGHPVTLFEAHQTLGGRARTSPPPYVAHDGPHVFYRDGDPWTWLSERGLVPSPRPIGVSHSSPACRALWRNRTNGTGLPPCDWRGFGARD